MVQPQGRHANDETVCGQTGAGHAVQPANTRKILPCLEYSYFNHSFDLMITGAAWLSSASASEAFGLFHLTSAILTVRSLPYSPVSMRDGCWRNMTSRHGPYDMGYRRATRIVTK